MTTAQTSSNLARPQRGLSRWAWIAIVSVVAVVLLVAGTYIGWSTNATRQLARATEAARARGEIVWPDDYVPPVAADGQNAVFYIRRAAACVNANPEDDWKPLESGNEPIALPLRDEEHAAAQRLLAANAAALADLRLAQALPTAAWPTTIRDHIAERSNADFKNLRRLAQLLRVAILTNHQDGNDAEAVEQLGDLLRLADAAGDSPPSAISDLVSVGIQAIAADVCRQIAPDLRVASGSAPATTPTSAPASASASRVNELIQRFLDERHYRAAWSRHAQGERAFSLEMSQVFSSKPLIGPRYRFLQVRLIRLTSALMEAGQAPNLPAGLGIVKGARPDPDSLGLLSALIAGHDRWVTTHFRGLCDRRAAATALAIRTYQIDHGGTRPTNLDQLAPKYLAAVPRDPMAGGDRPLGYDAGTNGPPRLWSVGNNGTDEGGSTKWLRKSPPLSPTIDPWDEREDAVYYLDRQPRPSTNPSEP